MSYSFSFGHFCSNHWCRLLFIIPTIILSLTTSAVAASDNALLVKAGYITKFPSFVTWPEQTSSPSRPEFEICLLGSSELNTTLIEVSRYAEIRQTRPLIRHLSRVEESEGCEILYIAGSEDLHLDEIVAHTRNKPILTISDSPGFAERGVLINLYTDERQVRFEINRSAVRRSGLKISFRLFELARTIK